MAAEWTSTTLGALVKLVSGGTPSKDRDDYWGGSIPWVSAKDMKQFHIDDTEDHLTALGATEGTKVAPAGSVLMLTRGMTLLRDVPICIVLRDMSFNQDVKAIKPKGGLQNDFLAYLLLGNKGRLLSMVDLAGHGTGRLNTDELEALDVLLPSVDEQLAIAQVLAALDDKIGVNRRMSETLEEMARALFKSWFVDFDPVRAKAEGRDPGLPQALADLFPIRFVDSELGEIPEGWDVDSVYRVADVIYGAPFSSKEFNAEGIGKPLIRIRDLRDESPGIWTPENHPKGYWVRPGDIVVGMDGEFRAYLWGGPEAWLNQRVCVFKPKQNWSSAFVRNSILGPLAFVEATESATTVIHLGKADIDQFRVVVPPPEVAEAFGRLCQPMYEKILGCKLETRSLASLRDALLPKLISGELRVPVKADPVGARQ